MIGGIIGDIIGSVYETVPVKDTQFKLFHSGSSFTDDTILTIAVGDWIIHGGSLVEMFHDAYQRYPGAGWGRTFGSWAKVRDMDPYESWGNGSAMRVGCAGWAAGTLSEVEVIAANSAKVTHSHKEGIEAAVAVAGAIFLARTGKSKEVIREYVRKVAGYKMNRDLDHIRPGYSFQVYAIYSVPEAIQSFLESTSYESAIRNAVSLGGDADTQACIAGSIAEAFYGAVPENLIREGLVRLDRPLYDSLRTFYIKYCKPMWIDII